MMTKMMTQSKAEGANGAEQKQHFAQGINFYKIFWVFLIGSVVGFVIETVFCVIKNGDLQSRMSLMFIPLTVIYGIGAVALYAGLHKVNQNRIVHVFLYGAISGTVVEFIGSWAQEALLGSVSWDYSDIPFNIDGRVCLILTLCWGGLAVVWVRWIQPVFERVIAKIPNTAGRRLTHILVIVLLISAAFSTVAVSRWSERIEGNVYPSAIGSWLDAAFPNRVMEAIYPNMIFPEG